jgi:hypothetical protein
MSEQSGRLPIEVYKQTFADVQAVMLDYVRPDQARGQVLDPPADRLAFWRGTLHRTITGLSDTSISGPDIAVAAAIGHSFTAAENDTLGLVPATPDMAFTHRLGATLHDAARAVGYLGGVLPEELDLSHGNPQMALGFALHYDARFGDDYKDLATELGPYKVRRVLDGFSLQMFARKYNVELPPDAFEDVTPSGSLLLAACGPAIDDEPRPEVPDWSNGFGALIVPLPEDPRQQEQDSSAEDPATADLNEFLFRSLDEPVGEPPYTRGELPWPRPGGQPDMSTPSVGDSEGRRRGHLRIVK